MQALNRQNLGALSSNENLEIGSTSPLKSRVLQFGTGNFLRGFLDQFIDEMNASGKYDGGIEVVQSSRSSAAERLNQNDGLYTLALRGEGVERRRVITSLLHVHQADDDWKNLISFAQSDDLQLIVSNTTESGIVYEQCSLDEASAPSSFPAKVTSLLYQRFKTGLGGLVILPTELIENNGAVLKDIILRHAADWSLPENFSQWIQNENDFCNTLVDRIVSGFPKGEEKKFYDEIEYEDQNLVVGEPYHLLVVENGQKLQNLLPWDIADFNVIFTDDLTPYREAKVRVLNGGHTSSVLMAFLKGHDIVSQMIGDTDMRTYLENVLFKEVIPTLNIPESERKPYADSVIERFSNPTLQHHLLDISLNSTSKWSVRVLPTMKDSYKTSGKWPEALAKSLSALILFYTIEKDGDSFVGKRGTESYSVRDNQDVLDFFASLKDLSIEERVSKVMSQAWWGEDLTQHPELVELVIQGCKDLA